MAHGDAFRRELEAYEAELAGQSARRAALESELAGMEGRRVELEGLIETIRGTIELIERTGPPARGASGASGASTTSKPRRSSPSGPARPKVTPELLVETLSGMGGSASVESLVEALGLPDGRSLNGARRTAVDAGTVIYEDRTYRLVS